MSNPKNINLVGPTGILEAQLAESSTTPVACAVLCHPHPQYGGSMHDAVLETAEGQLTKHNIVSLRFNFRGVGNSEGDYANGVGEADDVLAAVDWIQQQHPDLPCLLLGYSFGAAAAWRAASTGNPKLAALWLVAAPVAMLDMTGLPTQSPTFLFHPDADDFTSIATLRQWAQALPGATPSLLLIDNANHFFAGAHDSLANAFSEQLAIFVRNLN